MHRRFRAPAFRPRAVSRFTRGPRITIDGTAYTFDPQIESVYKKRYNENYDLFMKKYGEAVWGYKKPEVTEPEQPETVKVDEQLSALVARFTVRVRSAAWRCRGGTLQRYG